MCNSIHHDSSFFYERRSTLESVAKPHKLCDYLVLYAPIFGYCSFWMFIHFAFVFIVRLTMARRVPLRRFRFSAFTFAQNLLFQPSRTSTHFGSSRMRVRKEEQPVVMSPNIPSVEYPCLSGAVQKLSVMHFGICFSVCMARNPVYSKGTWIELTHQHVNEDQRTPGMALSMARLILRADRRQ